MHLKFVFLLVSLIGNANVATARSIHSDHCTERYMSNAGKLCGYCPPGTFKYQDCEQDGESALCKGCDVNHFQPFCNQALSCTPCSYDCKWRYSRKVAECTLYTDIKCECEDDRYLLMETATDGVCLRHSACPSGQGVTVPGNQWSDTTCQDCKHGSAFSSDPSFQPCTNCSVCEYYNTKCTPTKDAVCAIHTTPERPVTSSGTGLPPEANIAIFSVIGAVTVAIAIFAWCFRDKIVRMICRNTENPGDDEIKTPPATEQMMAFPPETTDQHTSVDGNRIENTLDNTTLRNGDPDEALPHGDSKGKPDHDIDNCLDPQVLPPEADSNDNRQQPNHNDESISQNREHGDKEDRRTVNQEPGDVHRSYKCDSGPSNRAIPQTDGKEEHENQAVRTNLSDPVKEPSSNQKTERGQQGHDNLIAEETDQDNSESIATNLDAKVMSNEKVHSATNEGVNENKNVIAEESNQEQHDIENDIEDIKKKDADDGDTGSEVNEHDDPVHDIPPRNVGAKQYDFEDGYV